MAEDTKESTRKYPQVMWFPRSKTDMREFREVLKLTRIVQEENPQNFFNDKLLGEKMAKIGLINRVGMSPEDYIESYKDKTTGDVSYITNARMLMRIFRFLGWIRKKGTGKYILTRLGRLHASFGGEFPNIIDGFNEEKSILNSLKDFAFYSVNDTQENRDLKFKIRPFIWLLYNLSLEPQCIYQLIVTCFSSKSESIGEKKRIKNILESLRQSKTDLKKEFKKLGLDADNYSCVHNFYDSAKILVYLGCKLNLIERISNLSYGKKIAGDARYLKQASIFYKLTEKGEKYLEENINRKLIYFEDIEKINKENFLDISFILASLNFEIGNKSVKGISKSYLDKLLKKDCKSIIGLIKKGLKININEERGNLHLDNKISFNFWQSIPYENISSDFEKNIDAFFNDFIKNSKEIEFNIINNKPKSMENISDKIFVTKDIYYELPKFKTEEQNLEYISYNSENKSYGGQDRYSNRVSPTNSLLIDEGIIKINNSTDCLDLIAPIRKPDEQFLRFLDKNIKEIFKLFLEKTLDWEKDQHYVWVRNCFRLFGCEAIYSGSSGMLSRADISIISPFMGGIEAKSPRENRGSVASKAIRQADHAKKQILSLHKQLSKLKSSAIAIGRRITPQAIKEEKEVFRPDGAPVMLISDKMLYYLSLRYKEFKMSQDDLIDLFTNNFGYFNEISLIKFLDKLRQNKNIDTKKFEKLKAEIKLLNLD
jgi:hypothetical protein